jgi:hypothetical protein
MKEGNETVHTLDEFTITDALPAAMSDSRTDRVQTVAASLVRHLNVIAREVQPTEEVSFACAERADLFKDQGDPMRVMFIAALWALVACSSTAAFAQGPTSETAGSGATAVGEASQPVASKKAERAANRLFAKKVHQALNKTKGLAGTDIAVFANSQTGEVILGGFIDSQDQEHIATEAASKVVGVKSVTIKMTLRPQL